MNSFEKSGYEVNHYKSKITVDIDGKEYLICHKVFGKIEYNKQIEDAYKEAKKKGIVPITKWR